MVDSDSFDKYLERSQACKQEMAALFDEYGPEFCDWALHQVRTDDTWATRVGRKLDFDIGTLRDIWVFVESRKKLLGLSVNAVCKQASFKWPVAGANSKLAPKTVKGSTLRRRYQQAVRYLRDETILYQRLAPRLAELGANISPQTSVSDTERWWRRLVDEEVRRCAEIRRK